MTTQQARYAQMQSRLQEGLEILSQASDDDGYQLGMALLKLHAALEDHFRIEIAQKAPSLRMEVDDPKKTNWNELIRYGKQYLRLTEFDARVILKANRQRQRVAHGGNFEKSRRELVKYADFVERWCASGRPASYGARPWGAPAPAVMHAYQMRASSARTSPHSSGSTWYQSRLFFFLTFFLLPPLWAILILTDRHQASSVRLLAGILLVLACAAAVAVFNPSLNAIPGALQLFESQWEAPSPLVSVSPTPQEPPVQTPSPASTRTIPLVATDAVCTIVWVEHPANGLAGKNRAMVWEEIVMQQVDGSAMTARQFYDEVLVHNPELASDGYEFKTQKTYMLPVCE